MNHRERQIRNYVAAYNAFDIDAMLCDLDPEVVFEHVENGALALKLVGLHAFRQQAEAVKPFFSERKQTILSLRQEGDATVAEISYEAVLALDLPNGSKKGQRLSLSGKSVFWFSDDKIVRLRDEV